MDFINFRILDAIDIFVVALMLFQIYRMIRGTAALTIFFGIFLVYLMWIIVRMLNMELLSLIIGQVIGVGVLALLIVFQQEVRRYLLLIGGRYATAKNRFVRKLFSGKSTGVDDRIVNEISTACARMSAGRTGALIAIERLSDLQVYATTGDYVDGYISSRLIEAIFFKNSPMHDGAMIIRDNRIHSARCILPGSDNPFIPPTLGLRHRAAIGLTEHGDAFVIVVSEETGNVSVVENGTLDTLDSPAELKDRLTNEMPGQNKRPLEKKS